MAILDVHQVLILDVHQVLIKIMNKIMSIGIQMHIMSWENDADINQTKIINGLDLHTAKFILAFCNLFKSRNSRIDKSSTIFGNTIDEYDFNWDVLITKVRNLLLEYPEIYLEQYKELSLKNLSDDDMKDFINDLHCDLLGCSEFYYFRVFDSAIAYNIKENIQQLNLTY